MLNVIKAAIKQHPRLYELAVKVYPWLTAMIGMVRERRGVKEHLLSSWSLSLRSPVIAGRPMNITIEPTNLCNLQCPVCETGAGILGREGRNMTPEQFRVIIDKIARYTNTLMFYFMGEPFLNNQSYWMIRYAKDAGIPFVTTCTNGDPVNPEKLVASGIDEVSFQIGGMTQETHQIYRINSKLERVLKNLQETVRIKRESGAKLRVSCGFILMKHNEHELDEFRRRMREIDVDEMTVVDPCVRTVEQGHMFMPKDKQHWYYDLESFKKGLLRPKVLPKNSCPWIWYSLAIHVNGDVVPCCRDPKGEHVMGNLLEQSLDEIWNGDEFVAFRKRVLSDQGGIGICQLCSSYPASKIN